MPKGLSQQKPGAMVQDDKRITLCPIKVTQRSSGLLLSPRSKSPRDRVASKEACWCLWDLCLPCLMHTVYWSFTWKPPFPTFWCYVPLPLWLQWTPMQCGLCPTEPRAQTENHHGGQIFSEPWESNLCLASPGDKISLAGSVDPEGRTPPQWAWRTEHWTKEEYSRTFKYNRICLIGFWTCSGLVTLLSFSHLKWKCPSYACPTIVFWKYTTCLISQVHR